MKETKERLNNEIESLTRQLNRRERTSEETLARARTAESSLATLQVEHKQYVHAHKHRTRDLEESERRARDDSKRVEVEYEQLRNGIASMQHGWKRDLEWLKQSLANKEKELDAKHVAREPLLPAFLPPPFLRDWGGPFFFLLLFPPMFSLNEFGRKEGPFFCC